MFVVIILTIIRFLGSDHLNPYAIEFNQSIEFIFHRATIAHLLKPQLFPTKDQLQPADEV